MTYREALARILALRGGELPGMRPGLERIQALLEALGNPERTFRIAQVAGTNGKGSVSATLAAIATAAGLRTGLYTSPHLCSFRERIRIDGACIPEDVEPLLLEGDGEVERRRRLRDAALLVGERDDLTQRDSL